MSAEAILLLACARRFVRQDSCDEVRVALRDDLDWRVLLEMADAHSVMPLFYWGLQQECPSRVPQELSANFEKQARSNLVHTAELLKVLSLLEQNGIQAISLKGPVLAAWGYGDVALRTFSDLDLLIRPDDVTRAAEVLVSAGCRFRSGVHSSSPSALMRSKDGELIFESPSTGVNLDLHWKLFPRYFPESLDREEIWENLQSIEVGGQKVFTLSPENLLLFLAAHGGKHRWECLGWICDFAVILNRTTVDWKRLVRRAREAHIERMFLLALQLASDLLGTEQRPKEAISSITKLSKAIQARILDNSSTEPSPLEACRMNLRMLDSFRDKIKFLSGIVVTPGEAEWQDLRLPPAFYKLYYPYRLLRLIGKRGLTPLRSLL